MAIDLTNKPTVGGDANTWGQELNDALDELDVKKASAAEVYSKTAADARFVRTVNGTVPDVNGNVIVAGGSGGGSGTVTSVGGQSPNGAGEIATIPYSALTGAPTIPTQASDVNAIPAVQKGAASGVATLDSSTKVPFAQLPTGTTSSTVAVGDHSHSVLWSWMPAGSQGFVKQNGDGTWPDRPTSRSDVRFTWVGTSYPPIGGSKALNGVDALDIVAS